MPRSDDEQRLAQRGESVELPPAGHCVLWLPETGRLIDPATQQFTGCQVTRRSHQRGWHTAGSADGDAWARSMLSAAVSLAGSQLDNLDSAGVPIQWFGMTRPVSCLAAAGHLSGARE